MTEQIIVLIPFENNMIIVRTFKRIIAGIFLVFASIYLWAQTPNVPQVIPPSPQAAAFARYGEIPVDHSTGVPRIGVDLYLLQSGKLQIPISLSYHAAGQRVNDYGSTVGLGWVVNSHGVISRTTFGLPDEDAAYKPFRTAADIHNFITNATTPESKDLAIHELTYLHRGLYDTQSDRYSYNFPNHSGIFRFDFITDAIMTVPYAPIKIERKKDNPEDPIPYFEITAEDGTHYQFKDIEGSLVLNTYPNRSWYLSKIISFDKVDTICFTYVSGEAYQQSNFSQTIYDGHKPSECGTPGGFNSYELKTTNNYTTHFPIYISSINSKTTRVEFEYANDRLDKIKDRLTSVSIYNTLSPDSSLVRKIEFKHSYFGTAADKNLRLKLDAVTISGEDLVKEETYRFTYNDKVLPPFQGDDADWPVVNFHEDYWGYWNGTTGTLIPTELIAPQIATKAQELGHGGNRNPNPFFVDACMLHSIEHPTKGRTEFEFESNKTSLLYYGYTNSNNGVVGGLRIKSIKNYADESSPAIVKTYEYPGTSINQQVIKEYFTYTLTYKYKFFETTLPSGELGFGYVCCDRPNFFTTSSSSGALTQNNGTPVIYTRVIEYSGTSTENTGKKEYYYTYDPIQYNDDVPGPRYSEMFHYDRGFSSPRLTSEKVFRKENSQYKIVTSANYLYEHFKSHEFNTGFKIDRPFVYFTNHPEQQNTIFYCYADEYLSEFIYSDTKGYEDVPMLTGKEVYTYTSATDSILNSTIYNYENLTHLQPTNQTTTASTGEIFSTTYRYPTDFASSSTPNVYNTMVDKNILSPVVEQIKNKGTTFLHSSKTNYADWGNNIIAPSSVETKQNAYTNPYEPRIRFHSYDDSGNILSVSKENDVKVSFIYGYRKSLPVVEAKNTTVEELNNNVNEALIEMGYVSGLTSIDDFLAALGKVNCESQKSTWKVFNEKIRSKFTSNVFLSSYTYDALAGMTSSTDPNNVTTYFEYDTFQRLQMIKDDKGIIIKGHTYHYKE
jgi:hypothetical protein